MTIDIDQLSEEAVSALDIRTPAMSEVARKVSVRKRNRVLGGVAAAMLLVVGGGWFVSTIENGRVSTDGVASQGEREPVGDAEPTGVAVPNVVGLAEDEAFRMLQEAGFAVDTVVIDGAEAGTVDVGQIAETNPAAGTVAEPGSVVVLAVAAGEVATYERYDDPALRTQSYFPLIPAPESLGEGWTQFYGGGMNRFVLFDPAEEESVCEVNESIVVTNGLYAEYGFGESPDDALLLITRGDTAYLRSFFADFGELITCSEDGLGTVVTIKDAPQLPGAVDVLRFFSTDDLDQDSENILVLRDDLVLFLGVSEQNGQQPDVDQLVTQALADYDASN